jgi:tetratricopeptide (TPR) repeat protein
LDIVATLQEGLRHHLAGDIAAAEQRYMSVLAVDGDCADALNLLGVIRKAQGRFDEAVRLMRRTVVLAPKAAAYWQNLGNALSSAQQMVESIDAYERAHALDPANADLRGLLAAALYRHAMECGDRALALARLRRTLEVAPLHLDAIAQLLTLLDFQGASDLAHRPWAVDTGSASYRALIANLQEGALLAHRAWEAEPTEARFQPLWTLGYWVIGEDDFVAGDPDDPIRWIALGNTRRRQARRSAAEYAYRRALALRPEHPVAQFRLASLLLSCNRFAEADDLLRAIDVRHPGRQEAMRFTPAFIDHLRGRPLPSPPVLDVEDGPGLMIFAACDGLYFDRFADRLLHSAKVNAGQDVRFHLHVINPPPDIAATVHRFRAFLGEVPLACTTQRIDVDEMGQDARAIYAGSRFFLLPHLLAACGGPVLMLDIDTLVVGDLKGLVAAAAEGDFALVCGDRDHCEPWEWMYAGQILVNRTERSLHYFSLVSRYVHHFIAEGKAPWFLDQIALAACWWCGYQHRPRPHLIELSNDITHQGLFMKDGVELPIPPEVLLWPSYASTGAADGLNALATFQRYVIP